MGEHCRDEQTKANQKSLSGKRRLNHPLALSLSFAGMLFPQFRHFRNFAISQFRNFAISQFRNFAISQFRDFVIPAKAGIQVI
ncbi:MAG: hypothetical protein OEV26_02945 [Gallionella sp.]|nr:hypothetical protein [Gallionella sp.]